MQSFMLSSKSTQFLEYMELRTRTIASMCHTIYMERATTPPQVHWHQSWTV